jgi:transcriptional regulator NrdR family protein
LTGFSFERLEYPLSQAREAYRIASRQYDQAVEIISKSTKTLGAKDDVSLHRIGETVLYRLCNIDSSIS